MIESIHQAFSVWMLRICVSGLVVLAVVLSAIGIGRLLGEKVRRLAKAGALAIIMACVAVYATLTNGYPTNEDKEEYRQLQQRQQQELRALGGVLRPSGSPQTVSGTGSQRQSGVDATPRTVPHWAHGVYLDGERIDFGDGWVFPHGTNHLSSVEVMPWGEVLPDGFADSPIASFGTRLSLVPGVSQFLYGQTPSNSCVFTWENAREGRVNGTPFNGRIELFRNGDVSIVSNGFAALLPRPLPFAHDGFGQDEDWVRANFTRLQSLSPSLTNAEEIISIGYADWVDAQVGIGLTNGLYKFTATFTEDPPETTLLTVGDYSIAVTNAGEYSIVMEKGREYEFRTEPYLEGIDYSMQDDLLVEGEAPMLMSWRGGSDTLGEWTTDGGWRWLSLPDQWTPRGFTGWMPTLQGSPDVVHLQQSDFPARFSAQLVDYAHPEGARYEWETSDENIRILSPRSRETEVAVESFPGYNHFPLTVSATIGGQYLSSSIAATYGTNSYPGVVVSLMVPEIVFLNDDMRESRYYPVTCSVYSPVETNVNVVIAHEGDTVANFNDAPNDENEISLGDSIPVAIPSGATVSVTNFYMRCSETGHGSLSARINDGSGNINSVTKTYRCIEPVQQLVTTQTHNDRVVNPSRLVYGTNTYLRVAVNGDFQESEVRWSVVGPGVLSSTNGFLVAVTPTASDGTVIVEARFGDDTDVQPRFVLPIVRPRCYEFEVYYVAGTDGSAPKSLDEMHQRIKMANDIFAQIGITFVQHGTDMEIGDASYARLPAMDLRTNALGKVVFSNTLSHKAQDLVSLAQVSPRIKVFCVGKVVNSRGVAFSSEQCNAVFLESGGSEIVMAHELGHVLGLSDIYPTVKISGVTYGLPSISPDLTFFYGSRYDWPWVDGRGFYPEDDTRDAIIERLLMCGNDGEDGIPRDIPSGQVEGYDRDSVLRTDLTDVNVGAERIEEKERRK